MPTKRKLQDEAGPATKRVSPAPKGTAHVAKSNLVDRPKPAKASNLKHVSPKTNGAKPHTQVNGTKEKPALNCPPTGTMNFYVFGTNEQGQLGLGAASEPDGPKRPRINQPLSNAGIVQIATGGMHCIALTEKNEILTWGCNDLSALGRDTKVEGFGLVDIDANKNGDDSDSDMIGELNPKEATATVVDMSHFPAGTVFAQVAATDNASLVLTAEGTVYGWGTFKEKAGEHFFVKGVKEQHKPRLVPELRKIVKLAAGENHVLALSSSGAVYSFGVGEQYQLGRKTVDRHQWNSLIPTTFGLKTGIVNIGAGMSHSFAVHKNGTVYGWGLNSYGQLGVTEIYGEDFDNVLNPTPVKSFQGQGMVTHIEGGNSHTIAVTDKGHCLTLGRIDSRVTGFPLDDLEDEKDKIVLNERQKPGILKYATQLPDLDAVAVAAGTEHNLVVTKQGKCFTWGFNDGGRAGQGANANEVEEPEMLNNTALQDKHVVWAGAGGGYSMVGTKD